jgi:AAA domain-containing protein
MSAMTEGKNGARLDDFFDSLAGGEQRTSQPHYSDDYLPDSETEFVPPEASTGQLQVKRADVPTPQESPRKEFPAMPLSELMKADLEIQFLIEGILAADQAAVIAGPQKSLKTSIMLDLALALSQAGCFLGRFRVHEAKRVGVMTAEIGYASVRNTLTRICLRAGIDPNVVENLIITDQIPMISRIPDQGALQRFCLDHELEFLAVDPLYMCLDSENQSNTSAQGQQLRDFSAMCQEVGCTVLFAHHTKRETSRIYEPLDLGHLHGAGLPEFVRQWLLISRRTPYVAGSGFHELHVVVGGSVGHEGLWGVDINEGHRDDSGGRRWEVNVRPGNEIVDDERRKKGRQREEERQAKEKDGRWAIFRALKACPGGLTKSGIARTAKMNNSRCGDLIDLMIEDDQIVSAKVQVGNQNTLRDGYQLAQESVDE